MDTRYSILRPLNAEEQEMFAIYICNFFSPMNYRKNCELLKIELDDKCIRPLSLGNFLNYLKLEAGVDAYKYMRHIEMLIQKFVNNALLINAGNSGEGSPPFNRCYYAQFELTEAEKPNLFWLGRVIGEEYLIEKYRPYIVRFEGEYRTETGGSGTGSGILINANTVLTCRHNLTDLERFSCFLGEMPLEIQNVQCHDKHDIGIVRLSSDINISTTFPYFGQPYVLDSIVTLGYPPLRGMREAPMICQKGEINAISKDWNNADCITISSIVRPGNSGGPVISRHGYIVGIVTQSANSVSRASTDKSQFNDNHALPFYNAIASTEIVNIISELDSSMPVVFENYQ